MHGIQFAFRSVTLFASLTLALARPSLAQISTGGAAGCIASAGPCRQNPGTAGSAQSQNAAAPGTPATEDPSFSFHDAETVVTGRPYEAEAVTTMTQNLADGSTIQQTVRASIARDKDGRTVRIQKLGQFGSLTAAPASADGSVPVLTTIFDPVARLHIDFTSDTKVAHELAVQTPTSGTSQLSHGGFGLNTNLPVMMNGRRAVPLSATPPPPSQNDPSAEQLGSRTIEGVFTLGTRTKTIIPAGTIGNSGDITIVSDTWFSPQLRLVMESTQTDPRFGQTTYTVTDLNQTEPDPALFKIPPGYTIQTTPVYVTSQ